MRLAQGAESDPAGRESPDDLRRRLTPFPVPPDAVDFSSVPQSELRLYGLPPRPNAASQPLLRRIWDKAFARRLTLVRYVYDEKRIRAARYRPMSRQKTELAAAASRYESSSNWSGAYITANSSRHFVQIWGSWCIPGNLQKPPGLFQGPLDIPYICSNWIGLDGQRRYVDSSLPQIGTQSELISDGTTVAEAWTQWWESNDPHTRPLPLGLEVHPGDEVLCVITAIDTRSVVMVIVNLTSLHAMAVLATAPSVEMPDGHTVVPEIEGATAEWILERPRVLGKTMRYNFPDFGQSEFHDCVAIAADVVDIYALFGGAQQVLLGERLIRMFDVLPNPPRTALIAMPEKLSDTSLRVKYGGFGLP